MDCAQVREHVLRSAGDLPPDALAHARECAACRALAEDHGGAGRALAAAEPSLRGSLAALESRVEADLARETGALAWLRSRGRPARLAVVGTVLALDAALVLAWRPRPDLGELTHGRLAVTLGCLGALLVLAAWHAMRPLYVAPAPGWAPATLVALAVLAPVALGVLPGGPAVAPPTFLGPAAGCLALGAMLGGALLVIARALDRGGTTALTGAFLAAAAAGLAGNVLLCLHCPVNDPAHVVVGHAGVVVVLLAGCAIIAASGGRRSRR